MRDLEKKSRGYGFVEFEREKDFISAYRQASGKKILERRIEVDAEYGRTKKSFRPIRLGGGLNKTRKSKNHPFPIEYNEFKKKNIKKRKKDKVINIQNNQEFFTNKNEMEIEKDIKIEY